MKKLLSVITAAALFISCFAFSALAFAEDAPVINLGETLTITMPKNGSDETSVKFAKFVPTESGYYTVTCDTKYANQAGAEEEIPGGVIALDCYEGEDMSTAGLCFFMDPTNMTEDMKKVFEEMGTDWTLLSTLKFTASLEAGKTYYITGYQDGALDFTTGVTIEKHVHNIKQVERTGDESLPDGMYEVCDDWFCGYDELVTPYNVEYEVIEGADQILKRGEELRIRANGPFVKYSNVKVDGEELTNDCYTVEEGSTIVTVNAEYLDTLAAGTHTITVGYNDGEAQTDFTIEEETPETDAVPETAEGETTGKNTSATSPDTGAESVFPALAAVLAGGIIFVFVSLRKRVTE